MRPFILFRTLGWGLLILIYTQVGGQDVDKLARFEDWIRTNAWMHPNVTLSDFPQGNGLKATSFLTEHSRILTIPSGLHISRDSMIVALRSRVSDMSIGRFMEITKDLDDAEIISIGMMVENCFNENSRLHPYLSILPVEAPPLLFSWNQKELDYLQDDQLVGLARDTARRLEYVWNTLLQSKTLHSTMIDPSCLSLESFRRYYAITLSHSMWLPDNVLRIVPMTEQINHAPSNNRSNSTFSDFHIRNEKDGSISVHVDRWVAAGEQIVEEYDRLDNSLHLLQFGFVSENNPHHCVVLQLVPPEADWDGTACVLRDYTYIPDTHVDLLIAKYTDNALCLENLRSFDNEAIRQTCSNAVASPSDQAASALDRELIRNAARRDHRSDVSILRELEEELDRLEDSSTVSEADVNLDKMALAIRFRLEDAKLVLKLAERRTTNDTTTREEL